MINKITPKSYLRSTNTSMMTQNMRLRTIMMYIPNYDKFTPKSYLRSANVSMMTPKMRLRTIMMTIK